MGKYEERVQQIKAISPYSLPDNTADARLTTEQIKKKFYEPFFYLLILIGDVEQVVEDCKTLVEQNEENVESALETVAELNTRVQNLNNRVESIREGILDGTITAYTYKDGNGESVTIYKVIDQIKATLDEAEEYIKSVDEESTTHWKALSTSLSDSVENLETQITEAESRAIGRENNIEAELDMQVILLKQYADGLVSKAYKTMGSVNTYADLPSNPNNGDVYNILTADEEHGIQAGENVVWNGTKWDELGGVFDTSKIDNEIYQLKKDVKYLSTAGIISATYDANTGLMEFVLSDGANASYNYDTGYITVVYE